MEIENVGPAPAVGISLTLLERVKRPSARLSASNILRPGDKATISAYEYPQTVEAEVAQNTLLPMEYTMRWLDEDNVHLDSRRVAHYLLSRAGEQYLVVRYGVVDGSKEIVRIFR